MFQYLYSYLSDLEHNNLCREQRKINYFTKRLQNVIIENHEC